MFPKKFRINMKVACTALAIPFARQDYGSGLGGFSIPFEIVSVFHDYIGNTDYIRKDIVAPCLIRSNNKYYM